MVTNNFTSPVLFSAEINLQCLMSQNRNIQWLSVLFYFCCKLVNPEIQLLLIIQWNLPLIKRTHCGAAVPTPSANGAANYSCHADGPIGMSPGILLLQHPTHTPGCLPLHPLPGLPVAAERAGHRLMQPQAPQSCEHGGHAAALAAGSAPKVAVAHPCPPAQRCGRSRPAWPPMGAMGRSHSPARAELVSQALGGALWAEPAVSSF